MSDPARFRPLGTKPPYTLANKVERALWQASWLLLARWTPPLLFAWRAWLLRLFGAHIGAGARIYGSVSVWLPRNLSVEEGAIIGPGAILYNQGAITIGPRAVVSQRAHLCASSHDPHDPDFALILRPITIGEACWVAADAFVGPGVTMHAGAVLGARGALFADAQAFGMYRGNPAVLIGMREWRDR
jgi:putative colanic acid biosynthesis acetyltransferase WcaF